MRHESHDETNDRLEASAPMTRRKILSVLGLSLAAVPFGRVIMGCSSDGTTSGGTDSGAGTDGGLAEAGAAEDAAAAADVATATDAGAWATGGTAVMGGTYPDPFSGGLGSTCQLYCASTLGPCYAETITRKDISEGHDGLPVRLAFLLVDETCKPIPNATIDIWHCAPEGLYSGSDASDFCTTGDATARAARWFRGVQTSDTNGRVDFDTCFPGWYSSRSIHIHFTIRLNDVEYVTSQLFFDDALDDEIVLTQPLYNTRGARDTTNTTDNVIGGSPISDYTFQTQRMSDGAMLAWKAIVVRSSLSATLCEATGASGSGGGPGGDGGPGGPPPEGGAGPGGG